MRVEYSKRAVSDIRQIAAYYDRSDNPAVAERIAARIREVVAPNYGITDERTLGRSKAGSLRCAHGKLPLQNLLRGGRGHDLDHTHPPHLPAAI